MSAAMLSACTASSGTDDARSASSTPESPESPESPDTRGAREPQAPKRTLDGTHYYAFLASGTCRDVGGNGGTWIAGALFPDAAPEIRAMACGYQWAPAPSRDAPADVDALSSLGADFLTRSVEETPPRNAPTLPPESLTLIPPDPSGAGAPTGVTGCDVCGRVLGRQVFVILPADKMNLRTLVVATEGGQFVSFDVAPPAGRVQVFSAVLPPSPDDSTYMQGRVYFLEAPF